MTAMRAVAPAAEVVETRQPTIPLGLKAVFGVATYVQPYGCTRQAAAEAASLLQVTIIVLQVGTKGNHILHCRPKILRCFPQYCAEASDGNSGLMWHEMANVDVVGLMED